MIPGDGRAKGPRGSAGSRLLVRLGAAASLVFLAGALLPAVLDAASLDGGAALRAAYHPLCHQIPSRSLSLAGNPFAICARCLGLYLGGALALMLTALAPAVTRALPGRVWLALAVAPTVLDALIVIAGGTGLPIVPRLAIALPAGFAAGLALAAGLADLGGCRWTNGLPICSDPR